MSFYDDYVADGLACMCCGEMLIDDVDDDGCDVPTTCAGCSDGEDRFPQTSETIKSFLNIFNQRTGISKRARKGRIGLNK